MWSFARAEYSMSKREFFSLTLRQWVALAKRREDAAIQRDSMLEIMLAQLTAMVANTGFKGWTEPREPKEFMPSVWRREVAAKPKTTRSQRRAERKQYQEDNDRMRSTMRMFCRKPEPKTIACNGTGAGL